MNFQGVFTKMTTEIGEPIQYYLKFEEDFVNMNLLINKELELEFVKNQCLGCDKDLEIYRQGHCKSCFFELPQTADWIVKPELSKAHLGIEDRDLEYEKRVQLQPHIVYLALSSEVKIGVTRKTQVPTRWIDQGANKALPILEVPNRYLAGIAEVALKDYVADKTNWRKMLKNEVPDEDLYDFKSKLIGYLPDEVKDYVIDDSKKELELHYPVEVYPSSVKSLNFGKVKSYKGVLKGVKGQYLIFEDNTVCNVRGNEGYVVKIKVAI